MNKTFISAFSNSSSLEFRQLVRQVQTLLLSTIQINIPNAVSVEVTSISSGSSGKSIIVKFTITVVVNIRMFYVVSAAQVRTVIQNVITSGKLTSLNISQIYITG